MLDREPTLKRSASLAENKPNQAKECLERHCVLANIGADFIHIFISFTNPLMKKISVLFLLTLGVCGSTALAQFTTGRVVVLQAVNVSTGSPGTLAEYLPGTANQAAPAYSVTLPSNGATDN